MTIELQFTPEIIDTLNYERYHHLVPMVQRRMEVLWLKSHNLPHAQIAKLGGVSENTMRDYFQLYKQGGIEKLHELNIYRQVGELEIHIESFSGIFMVTVSDIHQSSFWPTTLQRFRRHKCHYA